METVPTPPSPTEERNRVLADLRGNYNLALLSLLPGVEKNSSKLKAAARRLDLSDEQFETYRERLLRNGLWLEENGRTHANFELLDLGELTVGDYMSMTVNILSKLSGDKPHEFETLSLATNRELIRRFVAKVNQALKNLYVDSQAEGVEKTTLFSWTHTGVIEYEQKTKKAASAEDSHEH